MMLIAVEMFMTYLSKKIGYKPVWLCYNLLFSFCDRFSLGIPGWPQIYASPAPSSLVLRLQVCTHHTWLHSFKTIFSCASP
jgi:hypothetical protein